MVAKLRAIKLERSHQELMHLNPSAARSLILNVQCGEVLCSSPVSGLQ
jgi:hypothetical protein